MGSSPGKGQEKYSLSWLARHSPCNGFLCGHMIAGLSPAGDQPLLGSQSQGFRSSCLAPLFGLGHG